MAQSRKLIVDDSTASNTYYCDFADVVKNNELFTSLYKEVSLLLSSNYPLNKSKTKWISMGLSVIRNYTPIIKFSASKPDNSGIQFTLTEWNELIKYKNMILNYFDCGVDMICQTMQGNHCFFLNNVNGKKMLTLTWNNNEYTIVLELSSVQNMFQINNIIDHKMELLKSVKFDEYYRQVLTRVHEYCNINNCTVKLQCIETVLDGDINMNVLAFKELLYVYKGTKIYDELYNNKNIF